MVPYTHTNRHYKLFLFKFQSLKNIYNNQFCIYTFYRSLIKLLIILFITIHLSLKDLGYDFNDSTMNSTLTNHNNETNKSVNLTQRFTTSNSNASNFVCFLISDFDQNDSVFLKLEETQAKLSSIFNSLNNSSSTTLTNNTIIANNNNNTISTVNNFNRRFLIFGWPVLNHCLQNNIVSILFILC